MACVCFGLDLEGGKAMQASAVGCEVVVAFAVGQFEKGKCFEGTGLELGDGVGGSFVKECAVESAFKKGKCFEVVREGK